MHAVFGTALYPAGPRKSFPKFPKSFPKNTTAGSKKGESQMKLSAKNIDKLTLAPGKSELVKSSDDCPGLRFRIRDNGWRGWEFKFGKLPRIPLGKYPAVSVMQAHDKAREYYFKAKQGGNPAQEIAEAKARRDETFGAAVEIYLQRRQSEFRPRSLRDVTRHLTVNLAALKKLSIAAVDRRSIAAQIARLAIKAPTQANRTSGLTFVVWSL
jgi:hypothetical protein